MEVLRIPFSKKEYTNFSQLIEQELGIRMPPIKKEFLKARLSKRLMKLDLQSYSDYFRYITSPELINFYNSDLVIIPRERYNHYMIQEGIRNARSH